jgi:hypothetical protein
MFAAGSVNNVSGGRNQVSSIKQTGANLNLATPVPVQQGIRLEAYVKQMQKGSNLSVTVTNAGATTQAFKLFDPWGMATLAGASANGADIAITSTFGGFNNAGAYTALVASLGGQHLGAVGAMFQFGSEATISSSNLKIYNGNLENYNNSSLKNYLTLAKDTYANDLKTLVLDTMLYLNGYFAIAGSLPAGGSLEILLNVELFRNF